MSIMVAYIKQRTPLLFVFILFIGILPACRVKEGCPVNQYTNRMDKKSKHGKSQLFPSSMQKKVRN